MVDSSSCHIYTARWGDLPVILKLIKADRVAYSVALQEFQVEESVLGRVRHPNIVRLLGEGSAPRKFLVLEHLSGGTLSHSLGMTESRLKTFSLLETLRMAHALATALNYLHNEWSDMVHLIHRDLKPDNVGWSADGVLKLFDFGLCTAVKRQRERTEQYQLTGNTGTLRYMAPEVVLSRSYHMSVDTYSFGILVWQIGAGKIPFKDMGKKAYVEQVAIQGLRPPLPSHWPVGFAQLLQVCWHEDKNVRPSFAEVISRLDGLIEEEGQGQRRNSQHLPLRPVLALIAAALIAAAFYLAATGPASVSAGSAVLAYISALALYALLLSMCDAWPLAPVPVRPGGGVLSETGSGGGDRKPPEDLEIGSHTLRSSALTVDLVEEAINPINSCLS
ncbi:kinase-like domain-containing protein [Ochromonadaceae sp. CCMP2298]|nr:kinase-like domain-containing protein [Ochromonadaceae sp. CCMP2298]